MLKTEKEIRFHRVWIADSKVKFNKVREMLEEIEIPDKQVLLKELARFDQLLRIILDTLNWVLGEGQGFGNKRLITLATDCLRQIHNPEAIKWMTEDDQVATKKIRQDENKVLDQIVKDREKFLITDWRELESKDQ